ncbi:hypothetical protein AAFC00_005056 [Neodothiora populina]|uniref:Fe2OG dioxygenase domain-containing protein n=1 Tax=Neodothiora populina TaxID=2781224 RepID=A0ABR3PJN2_9PEZI
MPHSVQDQLLEEDVFDPKIHLSYKEPDKSFTLADLGLVQHEDSTPTAGTLPFPLLSRQGVIAYRRSTMSPEVIKKCARLVGEGTLVMRNVSKCSRFVADFWSHPETTRIVSSALRVPLDVIMPMEMGHTNIQVTGQTDLLEQLRVEPSVEATPLTEEEKNYDPLGSNSVIPWHYDSYPYVCIIMLSDTTHMHGGYTYIKTGDGSTQKIEGPSLGTAVVLQGGQVEHLAARAFGTAERITTISSYRVKAIGAWDNSFISNVRPYDSLPELYNDWSLYRLKKMREEIEAMEAKIVDAQKLEQKFPHSEVEALCERLTDYSARTARQMIHPQIRDNMVSKFSQAGVGKAPKLWAKVKALPDSADHIANAMEKTEAEMPELTKYILDWCETKAKIERNIPETSQHGPFAWPTGEVYYFPDELVRQGLKEVLLDWMDRTGILALVQE